LVTPRLMPPAYVKRHKNDATDAEAICEAVTRPNMRFVATKTPEQQTRARCIMSADCCSVVFKGTKRIDGPLTASQIASASAKSCLLRLTYAFT
jgi:hypothetical protein